MAFEVHDGDREGSPLTGMGRVQWREAAKWLLAGALRHVPGPREPIVIPGEAPTPGGRGRMNIEALARTFMIAAPLLGEEPELELAGLNVRDYYAGQILAALHPEGEHYVGGFEEVCRLRGRGLLGHSVEGAALAVGLIWAGQAVWPRYSESQRDALAAWFSEVAHARTNSHNWRWFNVLMLSFLLAHGYEADRDVMRDHLENLLAYYVGDGWYRDGAQFDFYSCWAFQFYGPIWCRLFGLEQMPQYARVLSEHHLQLQRTYPMLFSRRGEMPMWGRSIVYRFAAAAPLAAGFLLPEAAVDPGWARRLASGCMLQFLTRDDAFTDGVPTLGFYRAFEPVVQSYSRPASPYWMAKLFVALTLPPENPFWTARENEGDWESLAEGQRSVTLAGPGLTLTLHGSTGCSELRPGKAAMKSNLLYTRLAYNTAFPNEADDAHGPTATTYSARQSDQDLPFGVAANLRYAGMREGVLYRVADLPGWMARADLAEIIVPGGVLRVDRLCVSFPHDLRLGHFALPHLEGGAPHVRAFQLDGMDALTALLDDGRGLAVVAMAGWDGVDVEAHAGLSAESDVSSVPFVWRRREAVYSRPALLVTLLLHRTDGRDWDDDALRIVRSIEPLELAPSGAPCGCRVHLADGAERLVDFGHVTGRWMS